MNAQDITYLIIGLALLTGTFVSAWVFFKVVKEIEEQDKKKK